MLLSRFRPDLPAVVVAGMCFVAPPASPQSGPHTPESVIVPRLSGIVKIDGDLDDRGWQVIPALPITMHRPSFEGIPSERTEFKVAHDGEYLYFSCSAFDSEPTGIRAPSLQRDESSFSNDWCLLGVDTFFDQETLLVFGTTPAGVRTDAVFPNDGATGPNFSWNTFWDAAVSRDGNGWYAEIRVPFASLRFQRTGEYVTMGIIGTRIIARKNEFHTFPAISPQWGLFSCFKASQSRRVALVGVRPRKPLYVTPYGIAGAGSGHSLLADETGYESVDSRTAEAGGDLKVGLTANLTLDLSVNTDFAQVEADDQQVNLTRYSLFFPEKRQFFQERNSVFEFSVGRTERLFHSRTVALYEGEALRIFGGARIVGRAGEWDVGALSVQTEAPIDGGKPENVGVARLRRRLLNENSYVGVLFTSRYGNSSTQNMLYGSDAVLRIFGQDYLTLNWSQSFEPDSLGQDSFLDRSFSRVFWQRRGVDGFVYELDLTRAGKTFEPGLGFMFRRSYSNARTSVGYGWRPGGSSPFLRYAVSLDGNVLWRGIDGSVETTTAATGILIELKSGHQMTAEFNTTSENLVYSFRLSDEAEVPAGNHTFYTGSLSFRQSLGSLYRTEATMRFGQYYDGQRISGTVSTTWSPSNHFEVLGSYQLENLTFGQRDQAFRAHIARLRVEGRANTRLSGAAFIQYNSAAHVVTGNLRFRLNPREGNDLYIVVNGDLVTEPYAFEPNRPRMDRWVFLVKYSRTLVL